jgi:hypothetical protein
MKKKLPAKKRAMSDEQKITVAARAGINQAALHRSDAFRDSLLTHSTRAGETVWDRLSEWAQDAYRANAQAGLEALGVVKPGTSGKPKAAP